MTTTDTAIETHVDISAIGAVSFMADESKRGSQDNRRILGFVRVQAKIDSDGINRIWVSGMNGMIAGIYRAETTGDEFDILIPWKDARKFVAKSRSNRSIYDNPKVTFNGNGMTVLYPWGKRLDPIPCDWQDTESFRAAGNYVPDLMDIIRSAAGPSMGHPPKLGEITLPIIANMCGLWGTPTITATHGDSRPARFTFDSVRDRFAGAVMPLRDDDEPSDDRLPAWIGTI